MIGERVIAREGDRREVMKEEGRTRWRRDSDNGGRERMR